MKLTLRHFIAFATVLLLGLAFIAPAPMVSPGHLIDGHKKLQSDCFACHTPFSGTPSNKCIDCHTVKNIGILNSKGEPLQKKKAVPFHQGLTNNDCTACHIDHSEDKSNRIKKRFSHNLLNNDIKNSCISCHQKPNDSLHKPLTGNCSECHSVQQWKPATFNHDKYFLLDKDHMAACATCHPQNDFKRYTCYGCHAHTPENIKSEHIEEGIYNYEKCVKCHRNTDKVEGDGSLREGLKGNKESD